MKLYNIILKGCDDDTVIPIELTEEEFELIKKIGKLSQSISEYSCMPILLINEV